jgi:hypothetical protein
LLAATALTTLLSAALSGFRILLARLLVRVLLAALAALLSALVRLIHDLPPMLVCVSSKKNAVGDRNVPIYSSSAEDVIAGALPFSGISANPNKRNSKSVSLLLSHSFSTAQVNPASKSDCLKLLYLLL